MKIRQILQSKKIDTIYSVTSKTSVYDALVLMSEKNIGAVMIIDDGKLTGIFSERDYARKIILKGKHSDDTSVSEVMTAKVITIDTDKKLEDAMQIMSDKHIRHIPVVEGEKLIGIISINDVVSSIIKDQKERIASLEGYISGSYA
jgi:CBS domain-containing protein